MSSEAWCFFSVASWLESELVKRCYSTASSKIDIVADVKWLRDCPPIRNSRRDTFVEKCAACSGAVYNREHTVVAVERARLPPFPSAIDHERNVGADGQVFLRE